jgi:hypothetical protein
MKPNSTARKPRTPSKKSLKGKEKAVESIDVLIGEIDLTMASLVYWLLSKHLTLQVQDTDDED